MLVLSNNRYFTEGLNKFLATQKITVKTDVKAVIDVQFAIMLLGGKNYSLNLPHEVSFANWDYIFLSNKTHLDELMTAITDFRFKKKKLKQFTHRETRIIKYMLKGVSLISTSRIENLDYKKIVYSRKKTLQKLEVANMNMFMRLINEWSHHESSVFRLF